MCVCICMRFYFATPRCIAINDQLAHMQSSDLFTKIIKMKY